MSRDYPLASKAGLSGLVLSTLLAGCSVGPKYKAPTPALTPFRNSVDGSAAGNYSPPPLDRWWTGFNDPMLETVVQRALNNNLDLAAALARVDQARAAAAGAGARLLPTADFGATATAERQSLAGNLGTIAGGFPTFRRDIHEYALGPAASWEIDLAGGLRHGGAAARDELQAAQAIQAGTRVTVAADAADAYLQIRGYQARLAVAKNTIATDKHLVQLVRNRYDAKISLSGALGVDSLNSGHLFYSSAFQAVGVGALRWRLLDFGKIDAEVAQARGANAEALAVYRQAVLRAAEDVENSFSLLSQTEAYQSELQAEVQALVQARDLSEQAYRPASITLTPAPHPAPRLLP